VPCADDVNSARIATEQWTTPRLRSGAVTAPKIAAGAVTGARRFAAGAVTAPAIAAGAVTAPAIAAERVGSWNWPRAQWAPSNLAYGAVTKARKIAAGAVTAPPWPRRGGHRPAGGRIDHDFEVRVRRSGHERARLNAVIAGAIAVVTCVGRPRARQTVPTRQWRASSRRCRPPRSRAAGELPPRSSRAPAAVRWVARAPPQSNVSATAMAPAITALRPSASCPSAPERLSKS